MVEKAECQMMRKATGMAQAIKNPDGSFTPVAIEADLKLFRGFLAGAFEKDEAFVLEMRRIIRTKTYKQQNTIFGLAGILFQCLNNRSPSSEEKENLVRDIMAQYGDYIEVEYKAKKPGLGAPKTRVASISELDIYGASRIIEGLLIELAYFDLTTDQQGSVKKIFFDWMTWRGGQKTDPIDTIVATNSPSKTEQIFREKNTFCMACTRGGEGLQLAHIVSRGANDRASKEPWNWLILCHNDHVLFQHQKGWGPFLKAYPHLKGRVDRAVKMAAELEVVENE